MLKDAHAQEGRRGTREFKLEVLACNGIADSLGKAIRKDCDLATF